MSELPLRRDVHRPGARPRRRPGHDRRATARRCRGTRSTTRVDVATTHRALEAQVRLHVAAGARQIAGARHRPARRWRVRRRPRRATSSGSSACRCAPAASACSPPTRWAPAGWAPTRRRAWPTPTASCTTRPACGSATRARSRPPSGTNPMITIMALAHRTGEAIARRRPGHTRPRHRRIEEARWPPQQHPDPRQALHRRRVGRARRRRARSTSSTRPPRRSSGASPRAPPRTSTAPSRRPAPPSTRWSATLALRARRATARRSAPGWPSAATSSPR